MAAHYNQQKNKRIGLLDLFYYRLTGDQKKIKHAMPCYVLQKFGGPYTIKQYREKNKDPNLTYEWIEYPLVPINPYIQERSSMDVKKFTVSVQEKKKKYKLQRSKPLPNQYRSFSSFM